MGTGKGSSGSVKPPGGRPDRPGIKQAFRQSEEAARAGREPAAARVLRAVDPNEPRKKPPTADYDPRKFRIPASDGRNGSAQYGYKASPQYGAIMSDIIYSRLFPELTNPGYFHRAAIHHFIEYLQSIRPSEKVQSALAQLAAINQMVEEEEQLLHLIMTVEKLAKLVERYRVLGLNASAARVAFQARRHIEAMPRKDKEIKDYLDAALKEKFGDLYSPSKSKRGKKSGERSLVDMASDEVDEHELLTMEQASERLAELDLDARLEDASAADERDAKRRRKHDDDDDEGDWEG